MSIVRIRAPVIANLEENWNIIKSPVPPSKQRHQPQVHLDPGSSVNILVMFNWLMSQLHVPQTGHGTR